MWRGPRAFLVVLAVVAVAVVAVVLTSGSTPYRVDVRLQDASQLVKGNLVTVAGEDVGTVEEITVDGDGMARLHLEITDEDVTPLRAGTRAIVRQRSLSGQANRYVALQLGGADRDEIDDGGTIPAVDTSSAIDLDALFNTFDPDTRKNTQGTIRLLRDFSRGREQEAGEALARLDPALAASSKLLRELDGDKNEVGRFVEEVSGLVTDTATQDEALAGLVDHLGTTLTALSDRRDELGQSLDKLPPFLRRANTTFVNLRATLDDLDPLVTAARPVVRNDLRPLLRELQPFAAAAEPASRDLARTIRRSGADNDLVELLRRQPALAKVAAETATRNGKERPGAFPQTAEALKGATPQVNFLRPYTPELIGWFDDFSTSGAYDAVGSFSRAGLALNQFTLGPALELLPEPLKSALLGVANDRPVSGLSTGRNNRCPGSLERPAADGSNTGKPSEDFNCDSSIRPIGR